MQTWCFGFWTNKVKHSNEWFKTVEKWNVNSLFLFINTLVFENKLLKFKPNIVCADAGYANCLIAHFVQYHNCNLLVPYVRPKGKKSEFGKHKFDYYFETDQYTCPNHKMLVPWNISKTGNIEYKIHKSDCRECTFRNKCIKDCIKTITRHLYDDCMLIAKNFRLSEQGKQIYSLGKQTIERVFAEGQERHDLRVRKEIPTFRFFLRMSEYQKISLIVM